MFFSELLADASNIQKGVFLMAAGVGFVFAVQVVFYLIVKLWPKSGGGSIGKTG